MVHLQYILSVSLLIGSLIPTVTSKVELPENIRVNIKYGDKILELNLVKTKQYVANKYLPIWKAHKNQIPQLMTDVMSRVQDFTMYQDVDKSAAVVYFETAQSFFGIIDTRFCIRGLTMNEILMSEYLEVGGQYVKLRHNNPSAQFHDDIASPLAPSPGSPMDLTPPVSEFIKPQDFESTSISSLITDSHATDKTLYAEILVLVTNDVVQYYTKNGRTLMTLIAHYLIHFNAVDMLYAKLAKHGVTIHINIAGIVLEAERIAFPYVNIFVPEKAQLWHIIADRTVYAFQGYLRQHETIFPRDSYDMFFISTDYGIQHGANHLDGIALSKTNVYQNRLDGFHEPLGVLVTRQSFSAEFIASAHELAHTMNVDHDSVNDGRQCNNVQCYAILQEAGSFCRNCISWSRKSIFEFQEYVRTNEGHCFLLNVPRSLYPYGGNRATLPPSRQCVCYGFQSHSSILDYLDAVGSDDCNRKLACTINDKVVDVPTLEPVDGTPCALDKVCWRRKCTPVTPAELQKSGPSGVMQCSSRQESSLNPSYRGT